MNRSEIVEEYGHTLLVEKGMMVRIKHVSHLSNGVNKIVQKHTN